MKYLLRQIIKRTGLWHLVRNQVVARRQLKELAIWEQDGKPAPPPHVVKQRTIRDFAAKFDLRVFVETGTYYGDMVEAMKPHFRHIYSIELSEDLYHAARTRFRGDDRISVIHGDSGVELGKLLNTFEQPALFWLDGHYSDGVTARGEKDTPIFEELSHIFNSPLSGHVVIIDDARCFGTDPAYPSMGELSDFISARRPNATLEIEYDSIRITSLV